MKSVIELRAMWHDARPKPYTEGEDSIERRIEIAAARRALDVALEEAALRLISIAICADELQQNHPRGCGCGLCQTIEPARKEGLFGL